MESQPFAVQSSLSLTMLGPSGLTVAEGVGAPCHLRVRTSSPVLEPWTLAVPSQHPVRIGERSELNGAKEMLMFPY